MNNKLLTKVANTNGWGECSRTCGWGTQVRTPTKSASDFKDCKLKDCPQGFKKYD